MKSGREEANGDEHFIDHEDPYIYHILNKLLVNTKSM